MDSWMPRSPLAFLWAGNVRDETRGAAHEFPGGGITAGLHTTVFSMQSQPLAPPWEREHVRSVRTGPTPEQALARGDRTRRVGR